MNYPRRGDGKWNSLVLDTPQFGQMSSEECIKGLSADLDVLQNRAYRMASSAQSLSMTEERECECCAGDGLEERLTGRPREEIIKRTRLQPRKPLTLRCDGDSIYEVISTPLSPSTADCSFVKPSPDQMRLEPLSWSHDVIDQNGPEAAMRTGGSGDALLRNNDSDNIQTPKTPPTLGIGSTVSPSFFTEQGRQTSRTHENKIYFDVESSSADSGDIPWKPMIKDFLKGGYSSPVRRRRYGSNNNEKSTTSVEDSSGISSAGTMEGMQPTHRATHQFIPRHDDEILLGVGDPIYVEFEGEDLWFTGTNLRTGQRGIFPIAYAFEIDFEEECGLFSNLKLSAQDKATFYLTLLGSIEVAHHKGNDVLVQAINKVLHFYHNREESMVPFSVLIDISFKGIHVIDKSRKRWFQCPSFDYFYSLQNISFCGAHPKQLRYFGFITKHPLLPRFACHVFLSNTSTQLVVDAIGRAFKRSYDEYMAFAHPTEDIFLE